MDDYPSFFKLKFPHMGLKLGVREYQFQDYVNNQYF